MGHRDLIEEVRSIDTERRKSHDRALGGAATGVAAIVALFIAEEARHQRAAERIADTVIGVLCALLLLAFVLPDLYAWLHGLPQVLVTP